MFWSSSKIYSLIFAALYLLATVIPSEFKVNMCDQNKLKLEISTFTYLLIMFNLTVVKLVGGWFSAKMDTDVGSLNDWLSILCIHYKTFILDVLIWNIVELWRTFDWQNWICWRIDEGKEKKSFKIDLRKTQNTLQNI